MERFTANRILYKLEGILKRAVRDIVEKNKDPNLLQQDFAHKVHARVQRYCKGFVLKTPFHHSLEVLDIEHRPTSHSESTQVSGSLTFTYAPKQDTLKYGGPGYPGREHGQLCEYPEGSRQFWKWDDFFCKWQDVYRELREEQALRKTNDWKHSILNTAAFDPIWGNNPNGEDSFGNNGRTGRPTDGLWGNPDIGESMPKAGGPQSDSLLQAVFNYSVDVKTILDFYYDLKEQLWGEEEKIISKDTNAIKSFKKKPENLDNQTYQLVIQRRSSEANKPLNSFVSRKENYYKAKKDSAFFANKNDESVIYEIEIIPVLSFE